MKIFTFLMLFSILSFKAYASSSFDLDYYPDSELYNAKNLPSNILDDSNTQFYKGYYLQSIYNFGELFRKNISEDKYVKDYSKSILADIILLKKYNFNFKKVNIPKCEATICYFPTLYFNTLKICLEMYKNNASISEIHSYANISAKKQFSVLQDFHKAYQASLETFQPLAIPQDILSQYEKESVELSHYKSKDVYFRALSKKYKPSYIYYHDSNIERSDYKIDTLLYNDSIQAFMTRLKDNYYKMIFDSQTNFYDTFSLIVK